MFGRAAAHLARPAQRRHCSLQFERLEDRLAMDGDNSLAADALTTEDDMLMVAAAAVPSTDKSTVVDELPGTFQTQEELQAWLLEAAVAEWSHLFGQPTCSTYPYGGFVAYDDIAVSPIVFRTNQLMAFNANSDTNLQVAGVDEADLVETDGEYLYILSGKELMIVRAGIGEELELLSRVELAGRPVGMYLDGDRLAIVSSQGGLYYDSSPGFGLSATDGLTYSPNLPTTTVTVLDVSDRSAPALVQKTELDGQLVASRVVDGELRLVLSNSRRFPPPKALLVETESEGDGSSLSSPTSVVLNAPYVFESQDEYIERVRDEILSTALPQLRILGLDGNVLSSKVLTNANGIHRSELLDGRSMTTIVTFDLSADEAGPAASRSIFTNGTPQVYATAESFYLFDERTPSLWTDVWAGPKTNIHKFDFVAESHAVAYSARGQVEGTLLNQFAADEHDGHLRVVSTPEWGLVGQKLSVLKQEGHRLKLVGEVSGLAPREEVYSVRFLGERAFLVTFRQVDPLFALDLSDPTDPRVLGELKIPGYSDYLQPIDENHLLAIGRGADEATGMFQELQVSIFNIADLTDPKLVHRYSFDGGRSLLTPATGDRWTRGDGDHHAVSYFAEAGVFALPIQNTYESGWWWEGVDTKSPLAPGQSGLQVFRIDVATGFTPMALIQHDTEITRSVQIGEHLYAISSGAVTVHDLTDPTIQLGELEFPVENAVITTIEVIAPPPVTTTPVITTLPPIQLPTEAPTEPPTPAAPALPVVPETVVPVREEISPVVRPIAWPVVRPVAKIVESWWSEEIHWIVEPFEVVEIFAAREVAPAERAATTETTVEVALPRVGEVPSVAVRSVATAYDAAAFPRLQLATKAVDAKLLNLSISRTAWRRSEVSADDAFAALDFDSLGYAEDAEVDGDLAEDLAHLWAGVPAGI